MTVGQMHPVKTQGLKDIIAAFPQSIQNQLVRKLLVFVTPVEGKLNSVQSYLLQDGKVDNQTSVGQQFEQYLYKHRI